jgi:type II secretory pathway component GspD/PulD (secretin)
MLDLHCTRVSLAMAMVKMMRHNTQARCRGWGMAWMLTLLVALCQAAPPASDLIAVDFENVDLRIFIKFVSETTGRVFLLDDRVRGQVSVRFANKIPIDQLSEVLESVLELKGFAAIPAGSITKIVPLAVAKQRGIEVKGSGPPATGDRR